MTITHYGYNYCYRCKIYEEFQTMEIIKINQGSAAKSKLCKNCGIFYIKFIRNGKHSVNIQT